MKRKLALLLAGLLAVGSLTACGDSNDGTGSNGGDTVTVGLGLCTQLDYASVDAGEDDGVAATDFTVAAVTLNEDGTIASVKVDAIQIKTNFDNTGKITSDTGAELLSKREYGDNYGMKSVSASIGNIEGGSEWYEQADAFENFCVGKTAEQVKAAMSAEQYASDETLLLGCTIKINGLVSAVEKACENAELGTHTANSSDSLNLGMTAGIDTAADASEDEDGTLSSTLNFTVVTTDTEDKITTCVIDAVQTTITWNTEGTITSDLTENTTTKYDLKEGYGMKSVSASMGNIADGGEWYEQADTFMAHVKGMTKEQVTGIAMDESGYPEDETLRLGCTMNIASYVTVVTKALTK